MELDEPYDVHEYVQLSYLRTFVHDSEVFPFASKGELSPKCMEFLEFIKHTDAFLTCWKNMDGPRGWNRQKYRNRFPDIQKFMDERVAKATMQRLAESEARIRSELSHSV